ncbi:hypothetical protein GBA63_19245 [Rubrobacter tropicus]|uniref:Uncharacterized protein n=1 Tax=Rubrobacter tropicus TaxID=2653851 RepID=A0A6G8QDM6_9ACTN|nr:hypothetical protein [Rubrobacter tropicus]QIN84538.1 hypothetical protein GBA63_19245 [Rubrobacter tropicus]
MWGRGVGHNIGYTGPVEALAGIGGWGRRRYLVALVAGLGWLFLSGLPTEMLDTPLFVRMTPVRWWDYPFWVAGAALVGLLAATYVAAPEEPDGAQGGKFFGGGLLSVFAIGCPVCNKLVVLALGTGGALSYFAPIQPLLGFLSLVLLGYALRVRLAAERSCRAAS